MLVRGIITTKRCSPQPATAFLVFAFCFLFFLSYTKKKLRQDIMESRNTITYKYKYS